MPALIKLLAEAWVLLARLATRLAFAAEAQVRGTPLAEEG